MTMIRWYLMEALHFGQVDHRVGPLLVIVGDDSGLLDTVSINRLSPA